MHVVYIIIFLKKKTQKSREYARKKFKKLSEKKKDEKRQYARKQNRNLSEKRNLSKSL